MSNRDYAQSLPANFGRIDGLKVILIIRGIEKTFYATPEQVIEINEKGFNLGEKIKLLYTDKTDWEIKRDIMGIQGIEKYLRKEE